MAISVGGKSSFLSHSHTQCLTVVCYTDSPEATPKPLSTATYKTSTSHSSSNPTSTSNSNSNSNSDSGNSSGKKLPLAAIIGGKFYLPSPSPPRVPPFFLTADGCCLIFVYRCCWRCRADRRHYSDYIPRQTTESKIKPPVLYATCSWSRNFRVP